MSGSKWLAALGVVLAICFASSLSPARGMEKIDHLVQEIMPSPIYIYVVGCISGAALVPILTYMLKRVARYMLLTKDDVSHDLYRLDHGILNVDVPPATMWMNIGYWKQTSSFPAACRALLDEVLTSAGLLGSDGEPSATSNAVRLQVIDLGFGCGDQSIYLAQLLDRATNMDSGIGGSRPFVDSYVGLTIVPSQFGFASDRLHPYSNIDRARVRLFCADAANPNSWSKNIHEAIASFPIQQEETDVASLSFKQSTWVLALDTLYHFSPSRELIFRHASEKLDASIMAFDLLLSDTPSIRDLILLRIVCRFAATPFANFLTTAQYKNQLLAAGYDSRKIDITDISEHVFAGMASFIDRRDGELKNIGLNIGRYRMAGKVFRWWARSGLIRGCIIVARK